METSTVTDNEIRILGINSTSLENDSQVTCAVCRDIHLVPQELLVFQLLFPTITLIANIVTCQAISKAQQLNPTLRLILLHLSFTDIMASVLYIYHICFSYTFFQIGLECIFRYAIFVASIILTLYTILYMSLERLISVFYPFGYRVMTQQKYVLLAFGCCWFMMAGIVAAGFSQIRPDAEGCFYPLLVPPVVHMVYGVMALTNVAVIIVINVIIIVHAKFHISKIAATLVGAEREKQLSRLNLKHTMTAVALVVPYIITNVPMYIALIYFFFDYDFTKTMEALTLINALSSMCLLNSLINPSIYIWRVEPVRAELKEMYHRITNLF